MLTWTAVACGVLQIAFGISVCVVSLNTTEVGHDVVAGLFVGFSFLHELGMLIRRWWLWGTRFYNNRVRRALLLLNLLLLLALFAFSLAFIVLISNDTHDFTSIEICLLEFQIFYTIIALIVFQLMDLGEVYEHMERLAEQRALEACKA